MNKQRLICAVRSSPLWVSHPRLCSEAIAASPEELDIAWYWRKYRKSSGNPVTLADCAHDYLKNAASLYRSPNLAFDEFWYRHEHEDVEASVKTGRYRSGWDHYLEEGARKQYNPVFWFDERWYQRQHSDVAVGVRNRDLICGFEHYLLYGIRQDIPPSIYFNTGWYRERNMKDIAGGPRYCPIVHYLLSSQKTRPSPAPFFDLEWYSKQYAIVSTEKSPDGQFVPAYEHYMLFGRRLGYSPSPYFDELAYREVYPEVAKQLAAGLYASGFEQYVAEGAINGLVPRTHLKHAGVDYAGPEFIKLYEQSLLLHLSQLRQLCDFAES